MIALGNLVLHSIRKVQASTGAVDGLFGPNFGLIYQLLKTSEQLKPNTGQYIGVLNAGSTTRVDLKSNLMPFPQLERTTSINQSSKVMSLTLMGG
jgi:hypothetical protein